MRKVFLVASLILFSLCAISQNRGYKRVAPKEVTPVLYGQLKLTAPTNQMGYIVAFDTTAGEVVWKVRIYKVHYDVFLEKDAQDVYINDIELRNDNLLIRDDTDQHYLLNLKTLAVAKLSP